MFLPSNITLKPGDSGDYVSELQRRLAQRDLMSESQINGSYDGLTTNAVKAFQAANGLSVDGIAGPETIRRLNSFANSNNDETSTEDTDQSDEEKEVESANRSDDFIISENAVLADELANDAIRDGGDRANKKEDTTIDELRAKAGDEHGLGREEQALWQQEEKLQVKDTLEKRSQDQASVRHAQHDIANAERAQGQEQLNVTQEGIEARNPLATSADKHVDPQLKQEQLQAQTRDQAEIIQSQESQMQTQPEYLRDPSQHNAQREIRVDPGRLNGQQRSANQPPAMSPEMQRTDAMLEPGSKNASRSEGQNLQSRGVRDNGSVPITQLGELSPAQTPAVGRQQQLGM